MNSILFLTFYPNNGASSGVRSQLAQQMIGSASKLVGKVIVVDGGSSNDFLQSIKAANVDIISQVSKGLNEARKEAIGHAAASGCQKFLITEPEKIGLLPAVKEVLSMLDDADIVIPARKTLSSYPEIQRNIELAGNKLWEDLTGAKLDMWFGPRAFTIKAAQYFLEYKTRSSQWGGLYVPVMHALKAGLSVKEYEFDYIHPPAQTLEEEGDVEYDMKRIKQLFDLAEELVGSSVQ